MVIQKGVFMKLIENIKGLQHIGIPTNKMDETKNFYESIGFSIIHHKNLNGQQVNFFELKGLVLEVYQSKDAAMKKGSIDHIALDVIDIEEAFEKIKKMGYEILENEITYLPFYSKGVKFFSILGPNKECIEFNQYL